MPLELRGSLAPVSAVMGSGWRRDVLPRVPDVASGAASS
jgi:hypothetical protein